MVASRNEIDPRQSAVLVLPLCSVDWFICTRVHNAHTNVFSLSFHRVLFASHCIRIHVRIMRSIFLIRSYPLYPLFNTPLGRLYGKNEAIQRRMCAISGRCIEWQRLRHYVSSWRRSNRYHSVIELGGNSDTMCVCVRMCVCVFTMRTKDVRLQYELSRTNSRGLN